MSTLSKRHLDSILTERLLCACSLGDSSQDFIVPNEFDFDIFLSHSSHDKAVVRKLAKRLKKDGLRVWFDEWIIKPGDSIPAKIENGLERSRLLILCMSDHSFGSDWASLESQTFRFRDPLNKDRRFLSLRLDNSEPKGSLAQFLYIDWRKKTPATYSKIVDACRPVEPTFEQQASASSKRLRLAIDEQRILWTVAFSSDGKYALLGSDSKSLQLIDATTGKCLRTLSGHNGAVFQVTFSSNDQYALSGSADSRMRLWDIASGKCIRTYLGHSAAVRCVAFNSTGATSVSGSDDYTLRLWNSDGGHCLRVFEGHNGSVCSVAFNFSDSKILSGSTDCTLRLWDLDSAASKAIFAGHTADINSVKLSGNSLYALSGSDDRTVRIWDITACRCAWVLEGHTDIVYSVAFSADSRWVLSGSYDKTVRLWEVETGKCIGVFEGHTDAVRSVLFSEDGRCALSGGADKTVRRWDLTKFLSVSVAPASKDEVQYTNAKVLVVGDTHSGKTGLTERLARNTFTPSESTSGAWSTQWRIVDPTAASDWEREIWLWDFGGQADQRLVHQLYMERTALILLLFDADKEDVLLGLRDWHTALRRAITTATPQLLVAGRIDAGFKASRTKLQQFALENGFGYHETSAKENRGCSELRQDVINRIDWSQKERRTSPRIFKLIKDDILRLRDEGQVVHTFKELRELLRRRLSATSLFSDETLETVISLLDGPGVVKELGYGTYILLQPEWINAYAQAVIRTLRADRSELGCLPLRSIEEGKLLFQSTGRDGDIVEMMRLSPQEERIVLLEMERQLEDRGLCLRQGDKLVFPSHCGRDRPAVEEHPSVCISYVVQGYLDDIYATLISRLADSESFKLKELWRDAADFETLADHHRMGIKLMRNGINEGDVVIYFSPKVAMQEQVIFANYIHNHLIKHTDQVHRLRHYICPYCGVPKGNARVLMDKLLYKKRNATAECDACEKRFNLWDDLEKEFASDSIRNVVEGLQADDRIRLDTRRKGKLLALEVAARINSADQKCFEIPATEDEGIDMELEFTDEEGRGTGKRLYLQLKSGNSYLHTRQSDGAELFRIKDHRWVEYWLKQPHPVMLVIGTFPNRDGHHVNNAKMEFLDVRWMEISSYLKREVEHGKKVRNIVFQGERLDLVSINEWREFILDEQTLDK